MAKQKTTETTAPASTTLDNSFFDNLAAATGGQVLGKMKGASYFIDTGSFALNFACSGKFLGGGIPGGRIVEIFGPESSAKSYFGTNCLFGTQRMNGVPAILDVENAANAEWIERSSHLDINRVIRNTPPHLEACFDKMYAIIKTVRAKDPKKKIPLMIVYDSISVSPSKREHSEMMLPENATKTQRKEAGVGQEQPGERAKVCSRELRKLNTMMESENATVFIINQLRQKIGVMYGDDTTTAGGGNALKYYASLRLRTATAKKLENKMKQVLGVKMKVTVVKNRFFRPYEQAEDLELLFETGINPLSGLLKSLLKAGRLNQGGGGNYTVKEEYLPDGMETRKFKASMEENKVPLEVLLDCPALLDARSADEIVEYLKPFGDFEAKLKSLDISEVAIDDEDDMASKMGAFFKNAQDEEEEEEEAFEEEGDEEEAPE
jgi:recombination protein RecA